MMLGLCSMRPAVYSYIQGQLTTGQRAATMFITQQRLHAPTTNLMSHHPKLIARNARVAQLASFKLLVGAFQLACIVGLPETPALPAPALVEA